MTTVLVKTAGRPFRCEVTGFGVCKYCDEPVTWAKTPRGKAIPLEPFSETATSTEAHFAHCRYRIGSESSSRRAHHHPTRGVEMSGAIWRQLLMLVHPDKHHGGNREALANEITRWLLEQRERLIDEKDR